MIQAGVEVIPGIGGGLTHMVSPQGQAAEAGHWKEKDIKIINDFC